MSAVPLEAKAAIVVLVTLVLIGGFFHAPGMSVHDRVARTMVGVAICLGILGGEELVRGHERLAGVFTIFGMQALFIAAWVTRRRDDEEGGDDGGGGGGGGNDPAGPGPIDWDAFDRARDAWRTREPAA